MNLITDVDALGKAIGKIKIAGAKLDKDIHVAGCSALLLIQEHGNCKPLNALILAMPLGSRVNALREWAETYGMIKFDDEAKVFVHSKKNSKASLDDAMAKSWTLFKPEPVYHGLEPMKLIGAIIGKVVAREKKGVTAEDDIDELYMKEIAEVHKRHVIRVNLAKAQAEQDELDNPTVADDADPLDVAVGE